MRLASYWDMSRWLSLCCCCCCCCFCSWMSWLAMIVLRWWMYLAAALSVFTLVTCFREQLLLSRPMNCSGTCCLSLSNAFFVRLITYQHIYEYTCRLYTVNPRIDAGSLYSRGGVFQSDYSWSLLKDGPSMHEVSLRRQREPNIINVWRGWVTLRLIGWLRLPPISTHR